MADNETDDFISQADIERLLADADDVDAPVQGEATADSNEDLPDEAAAISQDDIDSLLAGTEGPAGGDESDQADEEEAVGDVISQDDIDSLLAAVEEDDEPADETVPAEAPEMPAIKDDGEQKRSNFLSQDEIDGLLAQEIPEAVDDDDGDMEWGHPEDPEAEEDLADQWGEEGDEGDEEEFAEAETVAEESAGSPGEGRGRRDFRQYLPGKKWLWMGGGAGGFILMTLVVLAVMMKGGPQAPETIPTHQIATAPPDQTGDMGQAAPLMPVSIQLNGFLVLAPDDNKAITYITADVSIYLSDGAYARTIENHQPLFRDLIFQEVRKAVNARNWRMATDMDRLKEFIKQAIQQSLPEEAVRRVFLTSLQVV
ncbi:MAG: hypothetical protein SWH61_16270 [Thermodesulfobacteriota bacterium]|nr:hypothetical protein [Thermodesulfobacteriota bacterium]